MLLQPLNYKKKKITHKQPIPYTNTMIFYARAFIYIHKHQLGLEWQRDGRVFVCVLECHKITQHRTNAKKALEIQQQHNVKHFFLCIFFLWCSNSFFYVFFFVLFALNYLLSGFFVVVVVETGTKIRLDTIYRRFVYRTI